MKLSIVTTLYNSARHLEAFHKAMSETAQALTDDYEMIMVNDGSPDNALAMAISLQEKDRHIKIIDLSRNFGEHKARMTGLMQSKGDFVFMIQCDLEVSPHTLLAFWKDLAAVPDLDLVYGIQKDRRGNGWERASGKLFYTLFNAFADTKIAANDAGCRLMTRRFVDALLMHKERALFFAGICAVTGFNQRTHIVEKKRLNEGSYSLAKKLSMAVNALTSFSILPLAAIFYMGIFILIMSVAYMLLIFFCKIAFGITISGWSSLIISVWFFGGLITASIGLVGIYLSRIFIEVKQRPYTIIKKTYE